ncbi:interleukin-10 receptor subunit alpha isoform X2 [Anolis carolinensis]|uniref:interleukin-10 receptor subunit alpha isoform X2 n=1 Tax=Anolis carolinensis TaxID=28377 RepID=UPI002F2B1898
MQRLLLLLLLLCWLRAPGVGAERPPAPIRPHFVAKTFHHFLRWDEPDPLDAAQHQRLLYEVQYRRYGNSSHWKPVPRCVGIALPSCDLSAETQQPRQRYYARVRVLVGSQGASKWVQAPPFRPEEATLWLSGVSLTTHNGLIHVSIQLPISPWGNVTYEDLHPWGRQFYVYVRMMFNGAQVNLVQVQNSTEFDLQGLRPGKEYCVSVEPRLNSFPTPGIRTEEQCLFLLPLKEGHTGTVLLLSLPILGTLLASLGLAWAYVKKPTKAWPEVLKSMPKSGSPEAPVVLQVKKEPTCLLSLRGPKEQSIAGHARPWDAGSVPPFVVPEKPCRWLARTAEGVVAFGGNLVGSSSSIGGSTDSGICLQDPSGSLGQLLSHGAGQSEDPTGCVWDEADVPTEAAHGGVSGYQKQAVAPVCSGMEGTGYPKVAMASGYLKQNSLHCPEAVGPGQSSLLSWQDPGSIGVPSGPLGIGLL